LFAFVRFAKELMGQVQLLVHYELTIRLWGLVEDWLEFYSFDIQQCQQTSLKIGGLT
jgi:hypothetical protein